MFCPGTGAAYVWHSVAAAMYLCFARVLMLQSGQKPSQPKLTAHINNQFCPVTISVFVVWDTGIYPSLHLAYQVHHKLPLHLSFSLVQLHLFVPWCLAIEAIFCHGVGGRGTGDDDCAAKGDSVLIGIGFQGGVFGCVCQESRILTVSYEVKYLSWMTHSWQYYEQCGSCYHFQGLESKMGHFLPFWSGVWYMYCIKVTALMRV